MKDKYIRRNKRWVKQSGSKGDYTVAMGFEGEFKAFKIQKTDNGVHMNIISVNWLDDK